VEHRLVGAARVVPAHQYRPAPLGVRVVDRGFGAGWVVLGTLLGPEGSDRFGSLPFLYGPGPGSYRIPAWVWVAGSDRGPPVC
jgi:hypothetical protein